MKTPTLKEVRKHAFKELISNIEKWGADKGILKESTPSLQAEKTLEELMELFETLTAQRNGLEFYINSKGVKVNTQEQLIDDIGDLFVTLVLQAKMQNLDLLACGETVHDVISKRTGKMIEGQFKKDK